MVFAHLTKKIKAHHDFIKKHKIEHRKKLIQEGIDFIDDRIQSQKDDKIAAREYELMMMDSYIRNGGDSSILEKLYYR